RQQDIPGRSGADEFSILLSDIESEQEAEIIVERILASIRLPLLIDLQKICLTASAGIALSTSQHHSSLDMLRDANIAMHHAKALGKGQYAVFDPEMRTEAFELWNLEGALRLALEQDELQLWYQPIVNANNSCIESFEALLRWHHPSYGWVSPGRFIPLAEEAGLIVEVDSWVINRACQTLKNWQTTGNRPVQVNINISARHFTDGDLLRTLQQAIAHHGINPQQLRLEITEGSLVQDAAIAVNTLTQIKSLGISVALDDFGTGYASLSYLQDLPLDDLKIDGYFVETMADHSVDVINTIIDLAHKLGLNVTAERVETFEQYKMLKQLGCDTVQGYLFSKALPESAARGLIGSEVIVLR
ncbi:MAG: bifunctional diguanylate cyclase/phosphodiesterase, partial [Cyanobacteria bacterium J06632_3]